MTPDIVAAPYYNFPQLAVKLCSRPNKMLVWGRGTGKTTIFADEILDLAVLMPRAKFAFMGLTYFHIRTKSMPAIIDQWERRGVIRDLHYFVGHAPPKKYGFPLPYQPPLDFKNVITFWNGTCVEFISFDRPEMARSGSYDYLFGDEAAKLKKTALDSDVRAANRGNKFRFDHIKQHHGELLATTMPLDQSGDWIFEHEELAEKYPEDYLYLEASAQDNIEILGEKYFRDNKRVMPEAVYNLEILNIRRKKNAKTFYPILSERHFYDPIYQYDYLDGVVIKGDLPDDCRKDGDHHTDKPLDLSFDFGTRINCAVVGQHWDMMTYRLLKNFYVESPMITEDVAKAFCKYYKYHKNKIVYLYGGSDGNKRQYNSHTTVFQDIERILSSEGWMVMLQHKSAEIKHMDKYLFFNQYLGEDFSHVPYLRINKENCKETIVSMEEAPVHPDKFVKDKRAERNESIPQWQTTHLSDAVDNLIYWKFAHILERGPVTSIPTTRVSR